MEHRFYIFTTQTAKGNGSTQFIWFRDSSPKIHAFYHHSRIFQCPYKVAQRNKCQTYCKFQQKGSASLKIDHLQIRKLKRVIAVSTTYIHIKK